ncbi:AAA family ATPase [Dactylosporangium sp. CA-139066]|uniref:AAA family ATPase n=1 Tax=Dactylosporangium sp. CA-139066 TaxID=3239930 RepID=UPI003D934855
MRLVGRERELVLLHEFVDDAASDGGALLIVGEAGVGKTALLDAAAAHAATIGVRVLRASGVEFEAEVSFAGLHQLLSPLRAELAALKPDYRRAIGVALGLEEGPPPDPLTLVNALLALLAGDASVLVVVDDLQWLDRASAALFAILARRLSGTGVGLLGVVRAGESRVFEDAGLAEIAVGPLDDDAAAALLAEAFPGLVPRAAQRVLTEAQGNPLALIELPAHLGSGVPEPSLGRTPVGRRLQVYFARQIDGLPGETRAQLLLAALDGTGELFPAISVSDLEPAERARLIHIHPITRGIQFRHPLTRSAIVRRSTDEERRQAHRQLANRHQADSQRRAWHLAEATSGPDEQIAQLLEAAALKTKGRGDPVGAMGLLLRAAELSPGPDDHHRRAMFATYLGADITGDLTAPNVLAAEASTGRSHTIAAAVAAAAYMVNSGGDIDTIHRLLLGALRNAGHPVRVWDAPLQEIVYVLQANCSFGSRADLVADYRAALDRLGLDPPEVLGLLGSTFLEPARLALPSLVRLDEAISGIGDQADHAHAVRLGIAAMYVDRLAGCRNALWRVVDHGRAGGAIASAIKAFALLGFDGLLSGDWDWVLSLAEEGLAFTTRHHYRLLGGFLQYDQAMVAAARGDRDTVRRITDDLVSWAAPNRIGFVLQLASHAKALAALSHGEFETAYHRAAEICSPETVPLYKPAALWVLLDLVEAAVRAGRMTEASTHVADIDTAGVAAISPRLALIAAGAAAMTAPGDAYRDAFDAALATTGASRWPFPQARIQLAYGERLRRAKATTEARKQLTDALDAFERLGAAPWAARARSELRASGLAHNQTPTRAMMDALTPQEREIAGLAAAGLTNKQIGERLYLSPRTVSAHLYNVFPKLGISSRAALRDALGDAPPSGSM